MENREKSSSHLHLSDNSSHLILQEQPVSKLSAISKKSAKIDKKIRKSQKNEEK